MTADNLIDIAFQYQRDGRLPEAEELYRRALSQDPGNVNALHMLGVLALNCGRGDEAIVLLRDAAAIIEQQATVAPAHAVLYHNLGTALLAQDQIGDAISSFETALRLTPQAIETWCQLGDAQAALDRFGTAAISFRRATEIDPGDWKLRLKLSQVLHLAHQHEAAADLLAALAAEQPREAAVFHTLAQTEFSRDRIEAAAQASAQALALRSDDTDMLFLSGRIQHQMTNLDRAESFYRRALELRPLDVTTLAHLALLLQDRDEPTATVEICRRLLQVKPDHANGLYLLGAAQRKRRYYAGAIESLRHCLQIKPDFVQAARQLGEILEALGRSTEAIACFERVITLQPDDADAHIMLGNLLLDEMPERAHACFLTAYRLRRLTTWPAQVQPAKFNVLLVMAPGIANTPISYLVGKSIYDVHFVCLMPDVDYDINFLRHHGDIVVNLLSDADQGRNLLPLARDLITQIGRPVINHPDKIAPTDRATMAVLLSEITGCRVPQTRRIEGRVLRADLSLLDNLSKPFLLRAAGKHGGDDFALIENEAALLAFVAVTPSDDYYAIDYIDYRSVDGFFRKYRLIFIDGRVLPYHLAIGKQWKVHHYTTEMDRHAWMREEEAAFLRDSNAFLSPANHAALQAIHAGVGLDYFGIDCAIDRDGTLVVFEVNASMLVHDDNAGFSYKDPYVAEIKHAFDAMLARKAGLTVMDVIQTCNHPAV